jgi:3-methyladenine DNA glycosylase AlkD
MIILVGQYRKAKTQATRDELFDFYMRLLDDGCVNNWDLVDVSAPYIGTWWFDRTDADERLAELAAHPNLWHRRAAIIFTFAFIRVGRFDLTWQIAERLLGDKHDLIHKAVGWMLREAGNRDLEGLREFLGKHSKTMPRTMLRYAIEKLDTDERKEWMKR